MPFCPQCRTEYRPGFTVCADCGVSLVDTLPEEPPPSERGAPLMVVYETVEWAEAEVLKAKLESHDIPAALVGETAQRSIYTPGISTFGPIRILVPADRAAEAREILREQEDEGEEQ